MVTLVYFGLNRNFKVFTCYLILRFVTILTSFTIYNRFTYGIISLQLIMLIAFVSGDVTKSEITAQVWRFYESRL